MLFWGVLKDSKERLSGGQDCPPAEQDCLAGRRPPAPPQCRRATKAAPAALRSAGLIERLKSIGYDVTDLGDDPPQLYKPDEESPRARNLPGVIAVIETLKPRVEQAVKSGALPLILSGDCSVALATVAGARRYFRTVSLIYIDRDADINVPATTPSGCVDGMVVSHLTGRGAAEMVRFWGEPPLVREPDLALFGTDRIDPSEEEALQRSTLRRYSAERRQTHGAGCGGANCAGTNAQQRP